MVVSVTLGFMLTHSSDKAKIFKKRPINMVIFLFEKSIMIMIITFIIIINISAKATQNFTSFLLPTHKYYTT